MRLRMDYWPLFSINSQTETYDRLCMRCVRIGPLTPGEGITALTHQTTGSRSGVTYPNSIAQCRKKETLKLGPNSLVWRAIWQSNNSKLTLANAVMNQKMSRYQLPGTAQKNSESSVPFPLTSSVSPCQHVSNLPSLCLGISCLPSWTPFLYILYIVLL